MTNLSKLIKNSAVQSYDITKYKIGSDPVRDGSRTIASEENCPQP